MNVVFALRVVKFLPASESLGGVGIGVLAVGTGVGLGVGAGVGIQNCSAMESANTGRGATCRADSALASSERFCDCS